VGSLFSGNLLYIRRITISQQTIANKFPTPRNNLRPETYDHLLHCITFLFTRKSRGHKYCTLLLFEAVGAGQSMLYIHTYIHTSYLKWPNVKKLLVLNHCRRRLLGLRRGKSAEINNVFRRVQKTGSVGAEVMLCGRLFQSRLPATDKARSPMVTSRVDRTVSRVDDDERRHRRLVSATRRMSSVK